MSTTLLTNPALNTRVTTFDTTGRQYFNLFPLPTRTAFTNNYTTAPRNTQFSKMADERLDHHFGDGDLVYLRYTSSGVDTNIGSLFPATGSAAGTIFRAAIWPRLHRAGSTGPAPQGRLHRAGSTGPAPQGRLHRAGSTGPAPPGRLRRAGYGACAPGTIELHPYLHAQPAA